jgi:Ca2+-binding RTX toxin-like protein
MATFYGTEGNDSILRNSLSLGVTTDPPGLAGTLGTYYNALYGFGGNDVLQAGDGIFDYDQVSGDYLDGGAGNDILYGGPGQDGL